MERYKYVLGNVSGVISSITIISTFLLMVSKNARRFLRKIINENADTNSQNEKINELIDNSNRFSETLKSAVEQLNSINLGMARYDLEIKKMQGYIKKLQDQSDISEKTQIITLRENIIRYYDTCVPKKHISRYGIRIVNELYAQYHDALGQNSYITELVEALRKLPIANVDL